MSRENWEDKFYEHRKKIVDEMTRVWFKGADVFLGRVAQITKPEKKVKKLEITQKVYKIKRRKRNDNK